MTLEQLLPGAPGCIAGKKGIIFDFDGTLVDSMRFWDMYTDKDYSFRAAFMKEKYDTCVTPKPGARELLALLRENGVPVCIATSTPRRVSQGFFERFPLDRLVDFYISSADVGADKCESPAIYFAAAERLGLAWEECVVFEDLPSSARMAKKGGFTVVAVYDESSRSAEQALAQECDGYIHSLCKLVP